MRNAIILDLGTGDYRKVGALGLRHEIRKREKRAIAELSRCHAPYVLYGIIWEDRKEIEYHFFPKPRPYQEKKFNKVFNSPESDCKPLAVRR